MRGVEVCYGHQRVLSGVNLDIGEGDFVVVVGPNGGGKTSLVKAILSMIPHSGEITYSDSLRREDGRLSIGYMPQVSLFDRSFPITIGEVVMSGIAQKKGFFGAVRYSRAEVERGEELMRRCSIWELSDRRIDELSGGQLQRALLCRAMISEPKLLILDEPTNFVDVDFEGEFYSLIKELNERMAIVMISHDIGSVAPFATQIVKVDRTLINLLPQRYREAERS